MIKNKLLTLGLLSTAFALQSCIDKSYDLDDIDMTLNTGADLTLPKCSTGDIQLRNIIEEGDVVKFIDYDNGERIYAVIQQGSADIQEINIPRIEIAPTIQPISAEVSLAGLVPGTNPVKMHKVRIKVGVIDVTLPDSEYYYEITSDDGAKYEIEEVKANVDPVVRGLEHVTTKDPVTATLTINVNGLPPMLNKVYLDNLFLTLPTELEVSACQFNGNDIDVSTIVNGKIPLTDENCPIELLDGKNREPITLAITMTSVTVDEKFKFTPNADESKDGEVSISGTFEVGGSFRLNTADIDSDKLTSYLENEGAALLAQIISQQSLEPLLQDKIQLSGDANITPIVLGKVTGDIKCDIANIEPIYLDDLPDFLNDPETVLDLDNPAVLLKTKSNIPATAQTGLTLTSNFADSAPQSVRVPSVNVTGSNAGTESRFYIADKEVSFFPEGYTTENTTQLAKEGSVKNLILKIPKQVDVDVDDISMHVDDVDITRPYKVDVDYQVFAPLIVGKNFKLVYSDTERDWGKDLDDLEDVDADRLELVANVTSNLPADIELSLVPIDANAKEISELSVNDVTVSANAQKQKITFTIKPANPQKHTLNDFIAGKNGVNQLDGIQYKAIIKSDTDGGTLYENAKIKLDDIQITIKGGITYDAN